MNRPAIFNFTKIPHRRIDSCGRPTRVEEGRVLAAAGALPLDYDSREGVYL